MLMSSSGPLALKWNYVPKMIPWFLKFIMNSTTNKMMHTAKNMHQILDLALPAYDVVCHESLALDAAVPAAVPCVSPEPADAEGNGGTSYGPTLLLLLLPRILRCGPAELAPSAVYSLSSPSTTTTLCIPPSLSFLTVLGRGLCSVGDRFSAGAGDRG